MYAIVKNAEGLEGREKSLNSHSSGSIYYYVNGNRVSVSDPFSKLSEEFQIELLKHFLDDREFEIIRK